MAHIDEQEVEASVGTLATWEDILAKGVLLYREEVAGVAYVVSAEPAAGQATALDVWHGEGRMWRRISRRVCGERWQEALSAASWRTMAARILESYVALHVAPLPKALEGRAVRLTHKTCKGWRARLEDGPSPGLSTVYHPTARAALDSLASVSEVEEVSAMVAAEEVAK